MEKQLTAMQELIEYFTNSNSFWFSFDEVEQIILDFGMPKEKQQIINAWKDGYGGDAHDENEYYNNTFKQE